MSRKGIEMLCDYSSETETSEEGSGKDTLYLPCGGGGGEGVSRKGIEMLCDYSSETEISEEGSGKDTRYLPCGAGGGGGE